MDKSNYLELRDVAQGDFAIEEKKLFYKGNLIAEKGAPFFKSSEEVFFCFDVTDEQVAKSFRKVVLLNYRWPLFFMLNDDVLVFGNEMQFKTVDGRSHAYRRVSHARGAVTKIIGSNFQDVCVR